MPAYNYEPLLNDMDVSQINKIEKIEDFKNTLQIKNTSFQEIMKDDVYNSTKIEGNILSRQEVTHFLDNGITIRGKSFKDYAQINNYQYIINAIKDGIISAPISLTEDFILQIHKMITEGELPANESGNYRQEPVSIRFTGYIPPMEFDIPDLMKELVAKYNEPLRFCETQFERICEFKRNFERIHPFIDGNGRTGRVLMNILFLQNGYGYITFPENERDLYFKSLEENTFDKYAADKMIQSFETIKHQRLTKEKQFKTEPEHER